MRMRTSVKVNYSVKFLTVDCKYLLFLQDFFFILKPKQYKKTNIADCLKKAICKLIKDVRQIKCQIIWRDTVRKLIDGLERLR